MSGSMTTSRRQLQCLRQSVGALLLAVVAAQSASAAAPTIRTVSAPEFAVSGGQVLAEVVPPAASVGQLVVRANGRDVTAAFATDPRTGRFVGLVEGLNEGRNVLTASVRQGRNVIELARIMISDHPTSGQILGPHQRPWICETQASGLGAPPASGPCQAPTRYDWFYRTTANTFVPLPSTTPPYPADLAMTTTVDGVVMPYIVRVESGVINESIYRIAILDDPANPISNPWKAGGKKPGAGWNGKLSWPFGGGASPAFRSGRNDVTSALQHAPLSLGFAVAFGTRNTFGTGSDDVVSAETLMMIKERFVEQYGIPKFTIGNGGSGGAIQQHLIGNNYPGLLDALTPGVPYPDVATIATDVIDCHVLSNYFNNIANPSDWPGTRRSLVDGYAVATVGAPGQTVCQTGWSGLADGWQDANGDIPNRGFDAAVPVELRYDPVTNPGGARGTLWDSNKLSVGADPLTGFARTLYDNIGVQYGLNALAAGSISKTEFLDLNEKIGGRDVDGNIVPQRSRADEIGLANAYRFGRVNTGENLKLPIIQTRDYRDFNNDIHTRERSFAVLERMQKANGTTANVAMWTVPLGVVPGVDLPRMALLAHNDWLERVAADASDRSYAEKVLAAKPSTLKDTCWDASGTKFEEERTLDPSAVCNQLFPVHANVRIMAGGPLAGDIMKCRLKAINPADYAVSFTSSELGRLKSIFPQGVCDWSKAGVGQLPIKDTWLRFIAPGHGRGARDAAN